MARKSGLFGGRPEVLEAEEAMDGEGTHAGHTSGLSEQMLSVGSTDWTPEQAEQYIDWRLQVVDAEIARLRKELEDYMGIRKRWLAVTGGRSKLNGNGNGQTNGHAVVA